MAKILIVHGISNQYGGEMELRVHWYPALRDGLGLAEFAPVPLQDDCFCPFYGHLFRPEAHLGGQGRADWEDVKNLGRDEAELLELIWRVAAETDPAVPGPEEFGDTLVWAPRTLERAMTSLAKAKYLADYLPLKFLGDLRQVALYLDDRDIRAKILDLVMARIEPDTKVVIGHSLGSVIAYEAICAKPENVKTLITLGSPLGIRNVVFDKLTPRPDADRGRWPGRVRHWTNVAAKGDIVAAEKRLAPFFGEAVEDVFIDSGWDAHSATRYLNTVQAGKAVARGLS